MEAKDKLIEKLKELVARFEPFANFYGLEEETIGDLRYEIASLEQQIAESETHIPEGYFEKEPTERYLGELPSKQIADSKEIPAGAEEILLNKQIAISPEFDGLMYGAKKHEVIEAMEEYASIRVKEAMQSNNLKNNG